jgi:hypothetical protein
MIEPRWAGQRCIVAATGPSLTTAVTDLCRAAHERGTHKVMAVNDAYRPMPFADALYACDGKWWDLHKGCADFAGEKWSSHGVKPLGHGQPENEKTRVAEKYGLRLVSGKYAPEFSRDPALVHYGFSSGFQTINWTLHRLGFVGAIVLVGFDMHARNGRHFFGNHPKPLDNTARFESWVPTFDEAAKALPDTVEIVNCTPGSALKCFRIADLEGELAR